MKKLIALLLAMVMVVGLFAACGNKEDKDETKDTEEETQETTEETMGEDEDPTDETMLEGEDPTDETMGEELPAADLNASAQILANIWNLWPVDQQFAVYGGSIENSVMGGPGNLDVAIPDFLIYNLLIPEAQIASVDEAGNMSHMMNGNNFTSGVVHLTAGTDVAAFAQAVRDAIQGNQWICGFPETLLIAAINDEYVLIAYGVNDAMDPFIGYVEQAYADAEVLYNEAVEA